MIKPERREGSSASVSQTRPGKTYEHKCQESGDPSPCVATVYGQDRITVPG